MLQQLVKQVSTSLKIQRFRGHQNSKSLSDNTLAYFSSLCLSFSSPLFLFLFSPPPFFLFPPPFLFLFFHLAFCSLLTARILILHALHTLYTLNISGNIECEEKLESDMCMCIYMHTHVRTVYAVCLSLHMLLTCLFRVLFVSLSHVRHTGWPNMLFIPSCQVAPAHLPAHYAILSLHFMYCSPAQWVVCSLISRASRLPANSTIYACISCTWCSTACPVVIYSATLATYLPA